MKHKTLIATLIAIGFSPSGACLAISVLKPDGTRSVDDSHVACSQLFAEYDEQAILDAVAADSNVHLGQLGPNAHAR
ncbi:MAG: hypothetical protein WC213_07645 [Arenimonas sp.]|jgi:hypothetical protein